MRLVFFRRLLGPGTRTCRRLFCTCSVLLSIPDIWLGVPKLPTVTKLGDEYLRWVMYGLLSAAQLLRSCFEYIREFSYS